MPTGTREAPGSHIAGFVLLAAGFVAGKALAETLLFFGAWPTVTPVALGLGGAFLGFRVHRGPRRLVAPMVALVLSAAVYDYLSRQAAPPVPPLAFALASLIALAAWAFVLAWRRPQA